MGQALSPKPQDIQKLQRRTAAKVLQCSPPDSEIALVGECWLTIETAVPSNNHRQLAVCSPCQTIKSPQTVTKATPRCSCNRSHRYCTLEEAKQQKAPAQLAEAAICLVA